MAFGKKPYSGTLQQIIHGHLGGGRSPTNRPSAARK
jgi:hypothetical protein